MVFNQHKPEDCVGMKRGWLQRCHFLLGILHENSFLFLCFQRSLSDLSRGGGLLVDGLDDTDGHGLPHVTHSKTPCEEETDQKKKKRVKE